MSRLRGSRGHTMIELLVSMSLLAVVMGAITTFWVSFNKTERTNQDQAQSMSQARNGSERIARQLRNLASPTDSQPEAVDYADDYDIVFRTVDATGAGTLNRRNVKRVRYCLSSSSDDGGTIWAQEQTWNTSVPPANYPSIGSCPDNSWGNKAAIAQDIVNRELALPLFGYTPGKTPTANIFGIRTELAVDVTPGAKAPAPTRLRTGVFLRNQNRAPLASCTAVSTGAGRQIVLNGSASQDPEGRSLKDYSWLYQGVKVAEGPFAIWTAPASGTYVMRLKVKDYGDLPGEADCAQPVVVS